MLKAKCQMTNCNDLVGCIGSKTNTDAKLSTKWDLGNKHTVRLQRESLLGRWREGGTVGGR